MSDALDALFAAGGIPDHPPATAPADTAKEVLQVLPLDRLTDFPKQPFRPYTPEALEVLRQSLIKNGVISPLVVRPFEGNYQIVSGHNRRTAAGLAGYTAVPCVVRELSDDAALVQMIETNLNQRKDLLPSEKAWAYRLRLEAMNRQGQRTDLTSCQLGTKSCADSKNLTSSQVETKLRSDEQLSQSNDDSRATIQRYVRLTYLITPLLELVDRKEIGLTVGVALSGFSTESQALVHQFFICDHPRTIDQRLVDKLLALHLDPLTSAALSALLSPTGLKPFRRVSVQMKPIKRFFSPEVTPREVEQTIVAALTAYFKEEVT